MKLLPKLLFRKQIWMQRKLEIADTKDGIHNYLQTKRSLQSIQKQYGSHILKDGLLIIRFQCKNRISLPTSPLISPINAYCNGNIRKKTDHITYACMMRQGKIKSWQEVQKEGKNIQWLIYYQMVSKYKEQVAKEGGCFKR